MKFPKDIERHILKIGFKQSFISLLKLLVYSFFVITEIVFKFMIYFVIRLIVVFPIYLGIFMIKISLYFPILFLLSGLYSLVFNLFLLIKTKSYKFLFFCIIFFSFNFYFSKNSDLFWSDKFWFNNIKRTNNLEIDFIEYNRSISKLLVRKNFKPLNLLLSEKGLTENFIEFKLKIFQGIPKLRYSLKEPSTEIFNKTVFPLLYRLDIDYSDFEYLSKHIISEVDIKDIFYLKQHKQNNFLFLNSLFNFFNQLNFKFIFDLDYFYNLNSFYKNYHDDFIVVRQKFRFDDFNLLTFKKVNSSFEDPFNASSLFYSGNSFWERFAFDSFLGEQGSDMDEPSNTLYIPEVDDVYNFPNRFFGGEELTLFNSIFGGPHAFYQKDRLNIVGHTRSIGYSHYDFELGERFLFWTFKFSSLGFGNEKFDFNIFGKKKINNDLSFSRYGVLGPILRHDWNLFFPHFFEFFIDRGRLSKGKLKDIYVSNTSNLVYYDNFFKIIFNNFSVKKKKFLLDVFDSNNLTINKVPPLLNVPRLNDSRLVPYENEIQGANDFFLTKYGQNIPKYPYSDLKFQYYDAKKTKISLWSLKHGKYNHELLWSYRSLSPFSLAPTKRRMTTSDFWILRKSFLRGFLNIKDIYFYLKHNSFILFLRKIENNLIYFIFNQLPTDLIFVEFKYFLLNFLLKFSFFDQLLINFSYFFNVDVLNFKWFLIRFFILISDIYLWFIFAYVKIAFSVFLNTFFDDCCGIILFYIQTMNIYFIDAFIPLQTAIATRRDSLFNELFFKHNALDEALEILTAQSKVMRRKGRTNFIVNWVRPSERNRKSLYGFYYSPKFRLLYYNLYYRPPYRKSTSYTWRRGNTILFGFGGKFFLKDFYSKKTIKLKRIMRYESTTSKGFHMHHIRMRPYKGYWPTYSFLLFNNYYGLRNTYSKFNYNNTDNGLYYYQQFFNFSLFDFHAKTKILNQIYFFNDFFNNSLRPKNLMTIFKHYYFFNKFRGYDFFLAKKKSLYKYDFHNIPFSGLKKSNFKKFSLPFLDLLQFPNQYLLEKPKKPFIFFRIYYYFFGVNLYKPKVRKSNYFPIMYKHSPVYQYKQYLMLLNWNALFLHGFFNTTNFFYPVDFEYRIINKKNPDFLNFSLFKIEHKNFNKFLFFSLICFFFDVSTTQYFVSKTHSNIYIRLQNLFVWSIGDYVKFWNYTSPYMERNFVDFFWMPITSLYTSRFLDDGMRLENGLHVLSYNTVFNRLFNQIKGTRNFVKKDSIMFIPGTGVEPLEQFFWTHNQHDFDFFYTTKYNKEWPIKDVSTLQDKRFLRSQLNKRRSKMLRISLTGASDSSIEIDPGINVKQNQFDEIGTYYVSKHHNRLKKASMSRKLKIPYDSSLTRIRHIQYKITSARKLSLFLIVVWYKFLWEIIVFVYFIFFHFFFELIGLYFLVIFMSFILKCFLLVIENFYKQQRNLVIWFGQRMLLYDSEMASIQDNNDLLEEDLKKLYGYSKKDLIYRLKIFLPLNNLKISNNYKNLRNFLILIFLVDFFKHFKNIFFFELYSFIELIKKSLFNNFYNIKFNNKKIIKYFFIIYIRKIFFYYFNLIKFYFFNFYYEIFFIRVLNKKWLKIFFSYKVFLFCFKKIFIFLNKIFHFLVWLIFFSFFIFFIREYLIYKNIYLTEISSIFLMFILLILFIWFLSIVSKNFIENFITSKFPLDQYLQDYSTDFEGESFVYEDSLYFYMQGFQEDELFDADSFPFYYSWFTQFLGTNFIFLFFAKKAAQANLEAQEEENYLSGFGSSAENSSKIYGTPAYLQNSLKNFYYHVFVTLFRQKDVYRFNNDISIFYEYEESLKTVTNLVVKINYNNSKNYKKFDLPWEIVDNFIYNQFLSNTFWYYHSELFNDTDRLLYFDNAETSTDYNEMMLLENRGDIPTEPITTIDLFENFEGLELIEFNNEDFEIDDVPIELLDFSEENSLRPMFNYYENFFKNFSNVNNLTNYNFYFYNDISEKNIINKSGWLNEVIFDRFLLNIVSKDFLFPVDSEILSIISIYSDNFLIKNNIEDTLLNTVNSQFRNFIINYMLNIKSTNVYRNNIYNSQTLLHLIRRLNYRKIPFKKIYLEYLKKFPKNRFVGEHNQNLLSFRWDKGVDLAVSLYHPHDVLFKLTHKIALYNFTPYKNNFHNFNIIPLIGYEMFNNKYKCVFFSNVSYYVSTLKLLNYPDLTLNEAERLWAFLGCTKKQWNTIVHLNKQKSMIFPYDDWDFPFIFISFLFAIHYHKSNKLRGNIPNRGGAPFGINIQSRFQVIKRTEKRQKWKKKRLLRPTEQSPIYYSIDLFEIVSSFFENLLFNNNKFIFFSKNNILNDFFIIFNELFLIYLSVFSYLYSSFNFFSLLQIFSFSFTLFFSQIFCYYYFLFFLFYLFFILINLNILNFVFFKFLAWLKYMFFFFSSFYVILLLLFFQNFFLLLIFIYFLNFFFSFFIFEFFNLLLFIYFLF
jgi:hypothetical protein